MWLALGEACGDGGGVPAGYCVVGLYCWPAAAVLAESPEVERPQMCCSRRRRKGRMTRDQS